MELKIDAQILEQFESGQLNFSSLDYFDLTGEIHKSLKKPIPPKALCYVFDRLDSIPDNILKVLNMDRDIIKSKGLQLLSQLKDYMKEANIIKTIKYKAEILKANEEDGVVLDKVCRVLVLGQGKKAVDKVFKNLMFGAAKDEEDLTLKYNKEKRLDLSNMTTI